MDPFSLIYKVRVYKWFAISASVDYAHISDSLIETMHLLYDNMNVLIKISSFLVLE